MFSRKKDLNSYILLFVLTVTNFNHGKREFLELPILYLCLFTGIVGGFLGITYRLPRISNTNLQLLSSSWFALCVSPISGGFFALVLYLLFVAGMVQGPLFPTFQNSEYANSKTFSSFLDTPLATYQDMAKIIFWSFVAGYSERFVQNLIVRVTEKSSETETPRKTTVSETVSENTEK
jgi:hypothetical protein